MMTLLRLRSSQEFLIGVLTTSIPMEVGPFERGGLFGWLPVERTCVIASKDFTIPATDREG